MHKSISTILNSKKFNHSGTVTGRFVTKVRSQITFATLRQGTRLDNGETSWFAVVGKPGLVASGHSFNKGTAMREAKSTFNAYVKEYK